MKRDTIQKLARKATKEKYKCRECKQRERCSMHTGELLPSELGCTAGAFRLSYEAELRIGLSMPPFRCFQKKPEP